MSAVFKEVQLGNQKISFEIGKVARQATSSVVVNASGTTLLVTVVAKKEAVEGMNFFPLAVHFQERAYALGKIPGGFYKREGRPSEREILISRLIDRSVRPLFPKGFYNEVQVLITTLSINPEVCVEVPAILATSLALSLAGLPFSGPVGAANVSYVNGEYVLNPSLNELKSSELDLMVSGTKDSVLMVESEASQLSEDKMLGAVKFGFESWGKVLDELDNFAKENCNSAIEWNPPVTDELKLQQISTLCKSDLEQAFLIKEKVLRNDALESIRSKVVEELCGTENAEYEQEEVLKIISSIESDIVRSRILNGEARIDGRDTKTVRKITVETGILERTHGSALFTRGETQAIATATLGSTKDAQITETPLGDVKETFMLHYNFPPYCVGETGMVGSPKRREIGHGKLAKRGIEAVLPSMEEFPYVKRVVSEITESNGSSSMASVCGASLALMDAGVPLKAPVAGIAMGLIKDGDKFSVLTDILGDEDFLGDMDFKVAGTSTGVTALQMDIKIQGITIEIMEVALAQAKEARIHILGIMNEALSSAKDLSPYAPVMHNMKVNPDKVKDIIGKGGATIKAITEKHQVTIEISDDAVVTICALSKEAGDAAKAEIEGIVAEPEVGVIYSGKVVKVLDFGAFVNFMPGRDGLLHISQIKAGRVKNVSDELSEGQEVRVKVTEVDKQGRVKLTMLIEAEAPQES